VEAVDGSTTAAGALIDGRYRLEQIRADRQVGRARTVLWRATDESLGRRVALLLVTGGTKTARRRLLAAAGRASRIVDSRFVRVLDAGADPDAADNDAWLVTEWVDAPTLTAIVRGEPLAAAVATDLVRQCAEAIAVLERSGLRHGRLHPDQILVPDRGPPRIAGAELSAALHGDDEPAPSDVVALGGILFAALTGRWPLPGWSGLPSLEPRLARQARPRLVRAGISRELDDITHQALTGAYADAHGLARALGRLPSRPLGAVEEPPPARSNAAWGRWAWRLVPPAIVAAIGLTGWALGSDLGRVPGTAREHPAALPPAHHAAQAGGSRPVWPPGHPPAITSFDPEGDGTENDPEAVLAVDHDLTTSWTTSTYRDDPHFGGLKSGVGLLLDLHHPVPVNVVELALDSAGADVEIRAGDTRPAQAADLPLVATANRAKASLRLPLAHPTKARYWLVWFTSLPPTSGGYAVGVAEVALLG
jgi:hypothetical protein